MASLDSTDCSQSLLRQITADNFVTQISTTRKRKRSSACLSPTLDESNVSYNYEMAKRRPSKTWKGTLSRKFTTRRSMRKKTTVKLPKVVDYSVPFGNNFDYFRFVDAKKEAKSLNEELHKKIDHEMKMRDGSMKMLAAAKHTAQQLEAAKSLHTSNCRMVAYMEHLQQCKAEALRNGHGSTVGAQYPCRAKVSVSDIRIPLMWKDSDHFKNKGNYRRFTVFCLVRIGTEVYETQLLSEVDRLMTDISFDDVITLEDIPHDFKCTLEVYAYEHSDDLTIASTQVKLKKKIHDISNTVGRRLSGLTLKEPFDMQSLHGPRFDLVASTTLKLSDASERTSSFDLNVNKEIESSHILPLFGSFCCRFVVQPLCLVKETVAGFLYVKESEEWERYWCSLQNLKINCWHSEFEADTQDPLTMIPVTKESLVSDTDPQTAERPNAFHIQNRVHNDAIWWLAADNDSELAKWWDGLQQHLLDQVVWGHACEMLMTIQKKTTQTSPYFQRDKRAGSLYDKTRTKRGSMRHRILESTPGEGSPLTLAFNRFTKDITEDRSPLSRNNSCPK